MAANKKYPRKTTKAEFNCFVAECKRLLPLFDLASWAVDFCHGGTPEGDIARAEFKVPARIARLLFTDQIDDEVQERLYQCDGGAISSARHECVHLLTAKLEYIATCRWAQYEEVSDEVEHIARVLEKLTLIPDVD